MTEAPRWTHEQDRILNALWEKGLDDFVIGERMGKKGSSVGNRRRYLGLPANTAPRLIWTAERVDMLRSLWAKGLTAEEIGREIGASRNAILGKRMRLGLPGRDSARSRKRFRPVLRFGKIRKPQAPKQRSWRRELEYLERRRPSDPAPAKPVSLMDLTADQCRFPLGDPEAKDFGFCGRNAAPGYPYCAPHCRRCYVSPSEPFSCSSTEVSRSCRTGESYPAPARHALPPLGRGSTKSPPAPIESGVPELSCSSTEVSRSCRTRESYPAPTRHSLPPLGRGSSKSPPAPIAGGPRNKKA